MTPPFKLGQTVRYTGGEDDGPMTVMSFIPPGRDTGWWVRCRAEREGNVYTRVIPASELVGSAQVTS